MNGTQPDDMKIILNCFGRVVVGDVHFFLSFRESMLAVRTCILEFLCVRVASYKPG